MARATQSSKRLRNKAVPVLGIAGVSFAVAGAAHASTPATTADVPAQNVTQHHLFLGEEEMSDVSLSTFYVFDKENAATSTLGQQKTAWWGGCGRCGCGRCGCGWRGCWGCGGCGGCCWSWGRCRAC